MHQIQSLETIRTKIKSLYETNPNIHINVHLRRPKINLENVAVSIKGVYPNIFRVEELKQENPKTYTLQYTDIFVHSIEILELQPNNL